MVCAYPLRVDRQQSTTPPVANQRLPSLLAGLRTGPTRPTAWFVYWVTNA